MPTITRHLHRLACSSLHRSLRSLPIMPRITCTPINSNIHLRIEEQMHRHSPPTIRLSRWPNSSLYHLLLLVLHPHPQDQTGTTYPRILMTSILCIQALIHLPRALLLRHRNSIVHPQEQTPLTRLQPEVLTLNRSTYSLLTTMLK